MLATTDTSQALAIGQAWVIGVTSTGVPSVLVTNPAGETVPASAILNEEYAWALTIDQPGAWIATVVDEVDAIHFRALVAALVPYPTLLDLRGDPADPDSVGYLRETSWSDEQIQDALAAETAAQARMCRIPPLYASDLREALMRRVAVNLARRGLPLMVLRGDAEAGDTVPPARDSEVRRLEGPYRRIFVG